MEHKQFIEELQSRLGKDKKEIDNLTIDMDNLTFQYRYFCKGKIIHIQN